MQGEFSVDRLKYNTSFLFRYLFSKDFFILWIVIFYFFFKLGVQFTHTLFYKKVWHWCSLMAQEGFSEGILARDLPKQNQLGPFVSQGGFPAWILSGLLGGFINYGKQRLLILPMDAWSQKSLPIQSSNKLRICECFWHF